MSRYETTQTTIFHATTGRPDDGWSTQEWVVTDGHRKVSNPIGVPEAEASIIAFALNAVAEGYTLMRYRDWDWDGPVSSVDYEGPTEGVAP